MHWKKQVVSHTVFLLLISFFNLFPYLNIIPMNAHTVLVKFYGPTSEHY